MKKNEVVAAVVAALIALGSFASITSAAQECEVTFAASAARRIGALNLAVDYVAAGGEFVGSGQEVECVDLAGADFKSFNDNDDEQILRAGWITSAGLPRSVTLMRCRFRADGATPQKTDFSLDVYDASDTTSAPLAVTAAVKEISCSTSGDGCGDTSGDGSVSATDALLALQRGIGLEATFNCEDTCSTPSTSTTTLSSTTTTTTLPATYVLEVEKTGTGVGRVTSSPTGINCGTDCDQVFNKGVKVTLTAVANDGSGFVGWSGTVPVACQGSTAPCQVTMSAARTVTATFNAVSTQARNRIRYLNNLTCGGSYFTSTLTVGPSNTSWTSYSGEASPYQDWNAASIGTTFTATLGTCGTAHFSGSSNLPADSKVLIELSEDFGDAVLNLYNEGPLLVAGEAQPQPLMQLRVDYIEESDTVQPDAAVVEAKDWCGDVSGDGSLSATDALMILQRGIGLEATFNCEDTCSTPSTSTTTLSSTTTTTTLPATYVLEVEKAGPGVGRVTSSPTGINCGTDCNQVFNKGVKVALTAVANDGSEFVGWSGDVPAGCQGSAAPCTVTMSANRNVIASFENASVACPTNGPITDLRNDCSDYGYFYTLPGLAEGLTTDSESVVIAQSDGFDTLGYAGPVTGRTTFTLTHASVNGGPFYAILDAGSQGSISSDGSTLNMTIKLGGDTYPFNGAQWVDTRPLLTVDELSGDVLRMSGGESVQSLIRAPSGLAQIMRAVQSATGP